MIRPYTRLALGLLIWLFVSMSSASALELETLLTTLQERYPPLLEARLKVAQSRGKLLEKQGSFDTKLKGKLEGVPLGYYRQLRFDQVVEQPTPWWGTTLFSGYRLGVGSFADYDGKKQTLDGGEIRTGLMVPLLRNGPIDPLRAELAVLELQIAVAELDVVAKELEAVEKALKAYWGWLAAQEKASVARTLLELAETRLIQLEAEIKQGKRAPIEWTENQRALLSRRSKVIEATLKLQEKALELALFVPGDLGPAPGFPQAPACPGPLDQRALSQTLSQALNQRPERLRLSLLREQNRIGLDLAENQFLPSLDLYLVFSQDLGNGDKSRMPLELEGGLSWEWPLQQRKAEGARAQLAAETEMLNLREGFVEATIGTELQAAALAWQASCQSLDLALAEARAAQTLLEAERKRFALGATDLVWVNLREQALAEALNKVAEAREAYFFAEGLVRLRQGLLPRPQDKRRLSSDPDVPSLGPSARSGLPTGRARQAPATGPGGSQRL